MSNIKRIILFIKLQKLKISLFFMKRELLNIEHKMTKLVHYEYNEPYIKYIK